MSLITNLVKLQEVDSSIQSIQELQGDLPKNVEELKSNLSLIRNEISNAETRLQEIEIETRKIQTLQEQSKEKISNLQEQVYKVKSNREYDALMSEIDHLKNDLSDNELKELELSDEKDTLSNNLNENKSENDIISEKLNKQKTSLDKSIIESKEELNNLNSKRENIISAISEQHLGLYDRIRNARGGTAVVPVKNQSCGGCHSKIPSQLEVYIRDGNKLTQCNVCRQILYWDDK
tara:strand:- start:132 stop:836 length:705 start_codon:yes stop_codon:yes gene_type:complete